MAAQKTNTSTKSSTTKTKPKTTQAKTSSSTTAKTTKTKASTAKAGDKKAVGNGRALHEREPKIIVRDSGYVLAALANDAVGFVRGVPSRVESWREEAPTTAKELRHDVPERARSISDDLQGRIAQERADVEEQVRTMRAKTREELEGRVHELESRFDAKAAEGAKVFSDFRNDPRVSKVENEWQKVWEQTTNTRMQVKAAWTSIRKTADVALDAGREQAKNARSQVKAAVTSARKTADTVAHAGREVAN